MRLAENDETSFPFFFFIFQLRIRPALATNHRLNCDLRPQQKSKRSQKDKTTLPAISIFSVRTHENNTKTQSGKTFCRRPNTIKQRIPCGLELCRSFSQPICQNNLPHPAPKMFATLPPPSSPDFRARIVPSFVTASFFPLYLRPFFSILSFSFFLLSFLFLRPSFLLPSPFSSSSCASSASSSSHSPSLSPPLLYDQVTSKLVSCLITFPTNIPLYCAHTL